MVLIIESDARAEPFQGRQLEILLRATQKLSNAAMEAFGENVVFALVAMLSKEETKNLD